MVRPLMRGGSVNTSASSDQAGLLAARLGLSLAESGEAEIEARYRLIWTLLEAHGDSATRTDELDEAVTEADRLIAQTTDHWCRPLASHAAGMAYTVLAEVTERAEARDAAVGHLTRALPGIDAPEDRTEAQFTLMTLLLARWSDPAGRGEVADLDAAIESGRAALELCTQSAGPADRATLDIRAVLGFALMDRYQAAASDTTEERQALDDAITELSAVTRALPGDPETADLRATLGRLHWARFHLDPTTSVRRRADVEAVIDVLRDTEDVRTRLLRGLALSRRYAETKAREDRDAAIVALGHVLDLDADDPEDVLVYDALAEGGQLLLGRAFENGDDATDLDAAIVLFEKVLPLLPADHPDRDTTLFGLAYGHKARGGTHPPRDRLDAIISCFGEVWSRLRADPAADDERRLDAVMGLGWARIERIRTFGPRPGELDAVIDELTAARQLLPDPSQDAEAETLVAALLGVAHGSRAQEGLHGRAGIVTDLTRAAELLAHALDRFPADDPLRAEAIAVLAGSVLVGVNLGVHEPPRMTEMVASLRGALNPPPSDPVVYAAICQALGMALARQAEPDLDGAITNLVEAARLTAHDDDRLIARFNLASVLMERYFVHGDIADVDAAVHHLDEADDLEALPEQSVAYVDRLAWKAYRMLARAFQGLHRRQHALIGEATDGLRGIIEQLPEDHPHRARWQAELAMVIMMVAQAEDDLGSVREALPLLDAAAGALQGQMREFALLRAASIRAFTSTGPASDHDIDHAIDTLTALTDSPATGTRACAALGVLLGEPHRRRGMSADLDGGISWLREALSRLAAGHPLRREVMKALAEAYRAAGDRPRSTSAGEAALEESAHQVLLQTGAGRAIVAGRRGNGLAQTVASWYLADGMPRAAIRVLELGRGLALHAATAGTRISDELRLAGLPDLSAEWDRFEADHVRWDRSGGDDDTMVALIRGTQDAGMPQVPDDLRRQVLSALAATPMGLRLASPPEVGEITDALRRTGADALCYLLPRHSLPGGSSAPGRALLVTAAGTVEELPLPRLHADAEGAVQAYADALAQITDPPDSAAGELQRQRWREALDAVCDWAWPAAVGPLLDRFSPSDVRPPRLVLLPMGPLGIVPWHAARTATGHYAVEQAVVSYAASGRQFIDAAHRSALDAAADVVIVSDPTGELTWSNAEARALRRHYPDARRLARPTAAPGVEVATPENVLAALPSADTTGASLLHLSCHGYGLGSPADSHLKLIRVGDGKAPAAPLTVERILRRARGRPREAPGGLVVLSACFSDLTVADHDEALTLASAFLAAGAATVVGTRWQITERAATLLSVIFHHHLTNGTPPPDALRAAQLWMLNPQRSTPDDLPPALTALTTTTDLDLTQVAAWAAFTHQGQ
jgi:tetratricopeptide (TPR) repeat protein